MLRIVLAVAASFLLTWLAFLAVLVIWRPRGLDLGEAKRLVPDIVRTLRALATDDDVGRSVRLRLALLTGYLAMPFDLVPDFIPVLGYADDVVVIALVLRGVVRRLGADALTRTWTGTPVGLAILRRLSGLPAD